MHKICFDKIEVANFDHGPSLSFFFLFLVRPVNIHHLHRGADADRQLQLITRAEFGHNSETIHHFWRYQFHMWRSPANK